MVKQWSHLSTFQQHRKISKAKRDILFFVKDPYLGNVPSFFPAQSQLAEIMAGQRTIPGKIHIMVMIVAVGMRSGKTTFGGQMALYGTFELIQLGHWQAFFDHILPGSPIRIVNIAKGKEQSKETVFAQIKAQAYNSPYFRSLDIVPRETHLKFGQLMNSNTNVELHAFNSSAAGNVGRTVYLVVFDELAKFDDTDSKTSGWQVYNQITKSCGSFKYRHRKQAGLKLAGGKLVIGSILKVEDVIMQLCDRAKKHKHMYQVVIPTWDFNPKVTWDDLEDERLEDPAQFWLHYGCIPYADDQHIFREQSILRVNHGRANILEVAKSMLISGKFYDPISDKNKTSWTIDKKKFMQFINNEMNGTHGQPVFDRFNSSRAFVLAGDPSITTDNFGLALGHRRYYNDIGDVYIIDGITKFVPNMDTVQGRNLKVVGIDPLVIHGFITSLCELLPIELFLFDIYNYVETLADLETHGLELEKHIVRLDDYIRIRDGLKSKTVDICNFPFVLDELKSLYKKGNKAEHPKRKTKDCSDAVANVLYGLQAHEMFTEEVCPTYVAAGANTFKFETFTDIHEIDQKQHKLLPF